MNKLKIIETAEYILAVSDEEIKEGDYIIKHGFIFKAVKNGAFSNNRKISLEFLKANPHPKVVAYQPKGNAPELDLPLLPEIVVEDDVKKLALINEIYPEYPTEYNAFIKGHKSSTKVYSEDDLREAIKQTRYGMLYNKQYEDEFIQSLKQPKTPKWFVAEIEERLDQTYSEHGCYRQKLKTTTINGKTYLIGTYLYE